MQPSPLHSPSDSSEPAWNQQFQQAIRDPVELCDRLELPEFYREPAIRAAESFPVFAPASYVDRMTLRDPGDPLLRQVLPIDDELKRIHNFEDDPVGDGDSRQQPGLIQKYDGRVLLITTGVCAIHCRYCFRRHYPYAEEPRSLEQWQPAIEHIATDKSIHEVILSGGDPLSLSDTKLAPLIAKLDAIPHLTRLRIHTRLPIVIPDRVTDGLLQLVGDTHMQSYFVLHANHANELSQEVLRQISRLGNAGMTLLNQAVLLRGVNDNVDALADLCEQLSDHGVLPYYLNQLDRVRGAAHFEVPIEQGRQLLARLRRRLPGYAVPKYVQEIAGEANKTVFVVGYRERVSWLNPGRMIILALDRSTRSRSSNSSSKRTSGSCRHSIVAHSLALRATMLTSRRTFPPAKPQSMSHDVTRLLQQIDDGNANAANELLPLIYDQLRALAGQKLRNEAAGQTLQGTALVHEAYIKLVGGDNQQRWQGRRHFFAAAAEAMRRILVDNARRKKSVKHGGDVQRQPLDDVVQQNGSSQDDVLAISEALERFSIEDPQKAELVKLRYFAGLTLPEIAELLGISRATASRHWTYARAWLFEAIHNEDIS